MAPRTLRNTLSEVHHVLSHSAGTGEGPGLLPHSDYLPNTQHGNTMNDENAEAERQPLQLKMWPHKQRAMATRMQALGSKLRDEWHMPHSEDSLAETLNKGQDLRAAHIQWSAAKHITSTDLVDKLIDRLEAQLTTLRDLKWWASRDFYGYTDFIDDTAGLALAFSAAVPLATYTDDPDEILMNRFDNID